MDLVAQGQASVPGGIPLVAPALLSPLVSSFWRPISHGSVARATRNCHHPCCLRRTPSLFHPPPEISTSSQFSQSNPSARLPASGPQPHLDISVFFFLYPVLLFRIRSSPGSISPLLLSVPVSRGQRLAARTQVATLHLAPRKDFSPSLATASTASAPINQLSLITSSVSRLYYADLHSLVILRPQWHPPGTSPPDTTL